VTSFPKFYALYRKSWSLNTVMMTVFRLEAEFTLFLRMRIKEFAKTL